MERIVLENYLKEGLSLRKIGEVTKKSLTTIRYWVDKYGLKSKEHYDKWGLEQLKPLIENSNSKAEILEKMGITLSAGNYRTLKRYFEKYGVDNNMFAGKPKRNANKQKYSDSEIFCENSQYSSAHLKRRVLKSGLIECKCVGCGNEGEWNGKKLVLQIDHINGVNTDNRIDNLRFMCPNCHSQTETFSKGKI
jgi:Zn finger protein HypA/HybF involved in hydrogenase expression